MIFDEIGKWYDGVLSRSKPKKTVYRAYWVESSDHLHTSGHDTEAEARDIAQWNAKRRGITHQVYKLDRDDDYVLIDKYPRSKKARSNPTKKRRAKKKTAFSDATTSFLVGKTHYRVGRSRKTNGDWRLHERWKDKHGAIHWDPVWQAPKVSGNTTAELILSGRASAEAYERKMIGLEKEYDEAGEFRPSSLTSFGGARSNPAHCIDLHRYPTDVRKLTAAKRRQLVVELSKEPVAWLKRKRASIPSLRTEKVQKLANSIMTDAIKAAETRKKR